MNKKEIEKTSDSSFRNNKGMINEDIDSSPSCMKENTCSKYLIETINDMDNSNNDM